MLPGFAIAITVLCVIVLAEGGAYLFIRNQKVGLGDLNKQFNSWVASFKGKGREIEAPPGDVLLIGKNGNSIAAPASDDPSRAAYDAVQSVLTEPLRKFAEFVELRPSPEGGWQTRFSVDGVTYAGAKLSRESAAAAVDYIKQTAGLNAAEKRKPQSGNMKVSVDGKRRDLVIQTAGSTTGEQLKVEVDPKKSHNKRLEELGFTDKQLEMIGELIREPNGLVLVSAPKGHGLTSTLYGILRGHDAFLTHIHTLEPDPDLDLEGITQNPMSPTPNPADDAQKIGWVISQEPEVVMVSRVEDARGATDLAKFAKERRVYIGLRASSTFEALSAWRKLVGDDRLAMKNLRLVINGRVMRKLCAACKVGYTPDPTTLRKLNMDPTKVGKLYQARTTPLRDPKGNPIPCEFCRELQFKGRTGVFETLIVDEDVKAVIDAGGSANQLKAVFRKQRGKYLQEQALAQVEAGETSVQEVLRVMKAGDSSTPPPSSSGAKSAARTPAR
jgi:general secretion pathway protein E